MRVLLSQGQPAELLAGEGAKPSEISNEAFQDIKASEQPCAAESSCYLVSSVLPCDIHDESQRGTSLVVQNTAQSTTAQSTTLTECKNTWKATAERTLVDAAGSGAAVAEPCLDKPCTTAENQPVPHRLCAKPTAGNRAQSQTLLAADQTIRSAGEHTASFVPDCLLPSNLDKPDSPPQGTKRRSTFELTRQIRCVFKPSTIQGHRCKGVATVRTFVG